MKHLLLLILIGAAACTHTLPDGRKYRLNTVCVRGHFEYRQHEEMRKKTFTWVKTYEVVRWTDSTWQCDQERDDTIWVK